MLLDERSGELAPDSPAPPRYKGRTRACRRPNRERTRFDSLSEPRRVSSPPVAVARSRLMRGIYLSLGLVCLGFAYLSFLPGIPTFDFVILAAFFFARSSPRFEAWLRNHRVFGKIIRGWQAKEGLTSRTKAVASAAIAVSLGASIWMVDSVPLRVILALVGVYAVWFVWSRPAKAVQPRSSIPLAK